MLGYINDEDLRSRELKKIFREEGFTVSSNYNPKEKADFLYLGVKGKAFEEATFKIGSRVYTLIENKKIASACKKWHSQYHFLYDDEDLIQHNTYLTTEALLAYMIIDNDISIYGSVVAIIGYGNCGKDIAQKLKALNAKVTVSNRGNLYEKEVVENGYQYLCMSDLSLEKFDYVINTVPVNVLTKDILATKGELAKIYDLASYPYGVALKDRCSNYYILNSLPSKYAYRSAAMLIYQAIMKKEEEYAKR